jgi:ketosteroid isomerase-like protein
MSSSEAVATVRKLFQAVSHRDAAGCFAAYHPDMAISEAPSLPYGGDYSGPKGVMQHAEAFSCTWDRYQPEASGDLEPEFLADGDRVVALWRFRAQGAGARQPRSSGCRRLPAA